jgi:hypothetical protein
MDPVLVDSISWKSLKVPRRRDGLDRDRVRGVRRSTDGLAG